MESKLMADEKQKQKSDKWKEKRDLRLEKSRNDYDRENIKNSRIEAKIREQRDRMGERRHHD